MSYASEVAYLGVYFLDASGVKIAEQAVPASSIAYALTTVDITAQANASLVVVYVWKNAGSGYAFVDDVTLARPHERTLLGSVSLRVVANSPATVAVAR